MANIYPGRGGMTIVQNPIGLYVMGFIFLAGAIFSLIMSPSMNSGLPDDMKINTGFLLLLPLILFCLACVTFYTGRRISQGLDEEGISGASRTIFASEYVIPNSPSRSGTVSAEFAAGRARPAS
jgi:hypothetical protein